MKPITPKLVLHKETIRSLVATDLVIICGGFPTRTITACLEGPCVPEQTVDCGTHTCTAQIICGSITCP